uniref:Uncharacterized protein n=1 Tax=Streptomyces auratus AGR0001 TaxID=1160718 RepID=J1RKQ9_9ACTN
MACGFVGTFGFVGFVRFVSFGGVVGLFGLVGFGLVGFVPCGGPSGGLRCFEGIRCGGPACGGTRAGAGSGCGDLR